ncbi:MAG: hypothetical protein JTT11_10455 [Candidatus Brockarchaeota archaeon]|nr:hypothetical protein [Candidatus Brockarchaeota archaeon]
MPSSNANCHFCGNRESALLWAEHKELGGMWVCPSCWRKIFDKNLFVASSGGSKGGGCSCGGGR